MLWRILHEAKHKNVIFIDFFDTIMFRQVHSHQLMEQWEKALKKKFSQLKYENLSTIRREAIKELGGVECAVSYADLLANIYSHLPPLFKTVCTIEEFNKLSYTIDCCMDMVTQYPNKNIIDILFNLKNQGKMIYLVSDYYLPAKCYKAYLQPYNIVELFDGIYCSSEYGKTKEKGDLYGLILQDLNINASDVIMIGDSRVSDVVNANKWGIQGIRYFPLLHKIKTNIKKKFKYCFSEDIDKLFFLNTFKNTIFGEYSIYLLFFVRELYNNIKKEKYQNITFLSRGGLSS